MYGAIVLSNPLIATIGLLLIEQPFEEDDIATHALFAQQISTAVCLDESIVSTRSAEVAIDAGACSIVNIKVGRVGGLEAVHGFPLFFG